MNQTSIHLEQHSVGYSATAFPNTKSMYFDSQDIQSSQRAQIWCWNQTSLHWRIYYDFICYLKINSTSSIQNEKYNFILNFRQRKWLVSVQLNKKQTEYHHWTECLVFLARFCCSRWKIFWKLHSPIMSDPDKFSAIPTHHLTRGSANHRTDSWLSILGYLASHKQK